MGAPRQRSFPARTRTSFVNHASSHPPVAQLWLARYSKFVVVAAFWLIFTGGHTTTSGAGMAFPDWPLSNGSLNPHGWLTNFFMFLEHGHRLTAGLVAVMVTILFGWVWARRRVLPRSAFGLALAAVIGVFAQALLGGLRVILDPQGIAATTGNIATTFRVLHGCCAQIELCLVVALAAVLSPVWRRLPVEPGTGKVARLAWITVGLVFLQLIVGATMRHLGAGLAIPTYPLTPDGGFMPKVHNAFVDLNFTHTRFGAVVVTVCVAWLVARALRSGEAHLGRPALLLLALVGAQFTLGMFVIWGLRPPLLTTLHVVNGAAVLATTVLLAVRASRGRAETVAPLPELRGQLTEAHG
jgi:cytochrome c oxidase assembly protein subunit 15